MKQYFACLKHAFTKKTLPMQTSILRLLFVVLVMSMCAPIWAVQDSTQYKALEQKLDSLDRELAKLNQEMIDQYNLIRQCKTPEQQLAKLEEYNVLIQKGEKLSAESRQLNVAFRQEMDRLEYEHKVSKPAQKQEELADEGATNLRGKLNGHEWVDLGLPSGTRWATCNVGAKDVHGVGTRVAWGELESKKLYSPETYKHQQKDLQSITGNPAYDLATAKWGEGWYTPTREQWEELVEHCQWEYGRMNGSEGVFFASKTTGNAIFLPATGYTKDGEDYKLIYTKYNLAYWGSTAINNEVSSGAAAYIANYERHSVGGSYSYRGFCVRAVCGAQVEKK